MKKYCIFGLNGTIMDRFSLMHKFSIRKLLKKNNIYINNCDIPYFNLPTDNQILNDYNQFQNYYYNNLLDIIPETKEAISYLNFNYIKPIIHVDKINQPNINIIKDKFKNKKILFDSNEYKLYDKKDIIKIDSNYSSIKNNKKNGYLTVGVAKYSIHMDIHNINDAYGPTQLSKKLENSRNILNNAGADYVIDSLDQLPRLIEKINYK